MLFLISYAICGLAKSQGYDIFPFWSFTAYYPAATQFVVWYQAQPTGESFGGGKSFDELSQLRAKNLGKDPASGSPLDSLIYDYNIRGWVTGINKNYVAGSTQNYFGMELGYDNATSVAGTSYANPAYNGNIAGTIWKSAGDGVNRKYDFTYDDVNRLKGAAYLDNHSGGGAWNTSAMDYSVDSLSYDANGNILSMNQRGFKIGNPAGDIDVLTYAYQFNGNSNKLTQVQDAANDTASMLGDFHYKGTKQDSDYRYDGNGNLLIDNNKGIDTIVYNYLNLPVRVHMKGKGNIVYTYDAGGNKLLKQTTDSTLGLSTATLYLDGLQYQRRAPTGNPNGGSDTLQFAGHEEGRARWAFHKYLNGDSAYAWEYDFAERDHLGNERVLLTQEKDSAQYMCTMEPQYRATENALFYNIDSTSYAAASVPGISGGFPAPPNGPTTNDSVIRVNGNGPKTGPAIILKVMAGDKITMGVYYYYNSEAASPTSPLVPQNLLNSLASGLATLSSVAREATTTLGNASSSPLLGALTSSISNDTGTITSKPQAYLNWMSLDNQFNYVSGNNQSGAQQVGAAGLQNGALQTPLAQTITISKSGYLYIYVSNATPGWDVFFDNLSIIHYSGPLIEENHYYPFGLTMAGISDKAIKTQYAENKYRFNKGSELQNKEFSDGSGLELYETNLRQLDPQIGRWWQIDSKPTEAESPYASMGNNPILRNDPLGDSSNPNDHWWNQIHLTPSQPGQYNSEPVKAALADISYGLGSTVDYFFGLSAHRDALNTLADGNASADTKIAAVAGAVLASASGEDGEVGDKEGEIQTEKSVPNPNGKKGSPAHQDVVNHAAAQMEQDGYSVDFEVKVNTPGGNKETRYVDVVGTKEGSPTRYVQVGVQNKGGAPVSRELKALDDINKALGLGGSAEFWPYKIKN